MKPEQIAAIKIFDEEDKHKGFDFKAAPLMRLALFRLSDERYRMLWTSHHILFDGWSFPILMEEFLVTYELLSSGTEPAITQEDRYEDYIRYIEQTDKEEEELYWRNYLKDIKENTLLPFIGSTIERNKGQGNYQALGIHLNATVAEKIRTYANQHRITLNTIMQGVWAYLLRRYTGNQDIVYGIIVSGRPDDLSGVEQRVGMYINTLPLYASVQEDRGITEWLQGIQAEQVNSRQYQHTPFTVVQGWSGIQGDLFDTLLTFENYPFSKVITKKKWALNVGNVDMQDHTNYPLSIVIGSAEQINIRFSYNALLLDPVYVQEIRDHFENVLLQLITIGDKKLSDINLLTKPEQQQLLVDFNDTRIVDQSDKTVVGLFEAQVVKTPHATALAFNEVQLTYDELNTRSNQLAEELILRGIKPGTPVPICVGPSLEMMIGILGILKAGAAYVPVDPGYPAERISYMLEDTGASIVITDRATLPKIPVSTGVEMITIGGELLTGKPILSSNLNKIIGPDQLAYIIYTSGSTGKPKGVMITHGNLSNYLLNAKTNYIASSANNAGTYLHLSYTFDASLTALFMPLISGKLLVIGSKQSVDVFEDINLLKYAPYDFIKITPAHLELLQPKFKAFGKGLLTEKLVIGGEALRPPQFDSFIADGINVEVINEYGPTEATVGCSTYPFYTVTDKDKIKNGISIGKPIDGVVMYILDEQNRLAPIGVKGEIVIGGAGVAIGYQNQHKLTDEKFITDPFGTEETAKVYRTGDIGRWLPDGNIEYLGRMDDQVKIRGYRVELGEVENVLQQCELVTQAVVLGKAEKEGSNRLVSYFVPHLASIKSRELEMGYQRVASWKELYETEYGQTEGDENIDPEFNIIGWNDSFTGEAMPAEDMKEWLDDIVEIVLSENPGTVMEIGCGTGLIYYQLAGRIKKYIGSDLSISSINQIKKQISKGLREYGDTELFTSPAHEVNAPNGQQVNTILLNSMVQYFPGEDYLTEVLDKSISLIKDKGRIIIGDVRDNRLLELFKARLRIQKLQDAVSVKEFHWGLQQDLLKEEELCISPDYFYGLKDRYSRITNVAIYWKQADYENELSLYRYTVVIHIGIEKETINPDWQNWKGIAENIDGLFANKEGQQLIAIKDVPNPRLWKETALQQALQSKSVKTVGAARQLMEMEGRETKQVKQLLSLALFKRLSPQADAE
jgi:amino acid adenylation domain-containing protein